MSENGNSWGCLGATILGSLLALVALADLLLGFELIPGLGLGGALAALIRLVGELLTTLTRPF
jgi:hypothetical protein